MSGPGHNNPPLGERLEIDHASLAQQATDVLAVEPLPPILVDEDLEAYSERAKALKGVVAMVEKARKAEKDQILKDGRAIDGFFQKIAKPLQDAADAVVAAINAWQRKKLEEQRERERLEAEAAKVFEDDAPAEAPAPVKEVARVVSASTGRAVASASTKWVGEVTDAALVPREYLVPDKALIDRAVALGAREIPGVRIFEQVRTAIR